MCTRKNILAILLALALLFSLAAPVALAAKESAPATEEAAASPTPKPEVQSEIVASLEAPHCKSAVLMEAESGQVLYRYVAPGEEEQAYPASITKVMTALLALEAVDRGELSLDQKITASDTFGFDLEVGGTTQNIQPGEQMSLIDLLYCMLLASANESCNIVAEAVSGDVATFVDAMNARAQELGMEDTHFANTHGLHNANHYTTAYDLALLMRQALKNETFATIVSSRSHEVPPTNLTEKPRKFTTTNALIYPLYNGAYTYSKAIGIKTGSTSAAGKCLASAAQKGKEVLICVVLGSEEVKDSTGTFRYQFIESKRLLEWGFQNFERKALLTADPVREIPVELSADTTAVALKPGELPEVMLPDDLDPADFQHDVTLYQDSVEAPVEAGRQLGELTVRNGDTVYATVPLVAAASAERSAFLGAMHQAGQFLSQGWVKIALAALVILALFVIVRFGVMRPRSGYRGGRRRRRGRR